MALSAQLSNPYYQQVAAALGIKSFDSQNDVNKVLAAAQNAGIKTLDSANDVKQILSPSTPKPPPPAPAPAPSPSPAPAPASAPQAQTVDYQRMYNDAVSNISATYDQQVSRYQDELASKQTELGKITSERDAALDKAKTWEQQYNQDREYQITEQLRGLRSGSSSSGGSTTGVTDLASGTRAPSGYRSRTDASISDYQRYTNLLSSDAPSSPSGGSAQGDMGSGAPASTAAPAVNGTALRGYYKRRFG